MSEWIIYMFLHDISENSQSKKKKRKIFEQLLLLEYQVRISAIWDFVERETKFYRTQTLYYVQVHVTSDQAEQGCPALCEKLFIFPFSSILKYYRT